MSAVAEAVAAVEGAGRGSGADAEASTDLVRIPVTVYPVLRVCALNDDVEIAKIAEHVKEKAWAGFMEQIGKARRLRTEVDAAIKREGASGVRVVIGQRFSHLVVTSKGASDRSRHAVWNCICDCGGAASARASDLRLGHTTSCGCQQITATTKYGQTNSRTYHSWRAMRKRCYDVNNVQYPNYGGRGIRVCDEWNDPSTGYVAFVRDMGERPASMTLDRKDANGNYDADNCRWATSFTQTWNKRTTREVREAAVEEAYWRQQEEEYLAQTQTQDGGT